VADEAVWRVKRVTPPSPVPSVAAVLEAAWIVGTPLLFGFVGALIAVLMQVRHRSDRTLLATA
jgi:hypothetical protein